MPTSAQLLIDAVQGRAPAETSAASVHVLIPHEAAGVERADDPLDDWRDLTTFGHRRAHRLVEHLRGLRIEHVLSSPTLRCRQAVVPLAEDRGLNIEPVLALASGADLAPIMGIIGDPVTANATLCADPSTIELLLDRKGKPRGSEMTATTAGPGGIAGLSRHSFVAREPDDG